MDLWPIAVFNVPQPEQIQPTKRCCGRQVHDTCNRLCLAAHTGPWEQAAREHASEL
jgi:hypothetical protein